MRAPTRRGGSNALGQAVGIGMLLAAAIGLAILIPNSSLFTKHEQPIPQDDTDAGQYTGEIRLAPTADGRCRVIAFDNRSGRLWDAGLMPCDADASAPEQLGRLDSISKSFKAH
jgi:hypothetical protein